MQSLGESIIKAVLKSQTKVPEVLIELTRVCLANSWEHRSLTNKLKERLSNREQQLIVVDEKFASQEDLFRMATGKL